MDPTSLNTLVGVVGIVVGIIGIVTRSIGVYSLKMVKKMRYKMIAKKTDGNVQQAGVIYNGPSYKDIEHVADEKTKQKIKTLTKMSDIDKLVQENPQYLIPVVWTGSEEEFNELQREKKIVNNAIYIQYE